MAVRKNSTKIVITEAGLLLPKGKSKRLASIAKPTHKSEGLEKLAVLTGGKEVIKLNQEALALLQNAVLTINRRIDEIKKHYPPGKQNMLFAIRYGDLEKLKQRRLKEIFELLDIEKPAKFNLIAELNYFGVKVSYTD
ncbi:hypothetical protein [Methylotuvimicrobium buryatense]|uniref:Uncharacterized protein n=1 Tax=Methylotuvimicrobium buryatense TaxID=95641 RepID=A0A4P9UQR9_METBY|nr:hypothetical protein [Methylotuvimicrobium buryatense]QCW81956.1 hypothetical protein EQU24_06600 [Methylotuvimicrobium buryatense]